MKRAFTLVELMIVIGIIAILASVLIVSMGNGTESARNAKCLTNLRNLAAAVQTRASTSGHYPLAGSVEKLYFNESLGVGQKTTKEFRELPGWISWYSAGTYMGASYPGSHASSSGWFTSAYCTDRAERDYCLTNGVLWKYLSSNTQAYLCPQHVKATRIIATPFFSYVMNEYFQWDNSEGSGYKTEAFYGREYGRLSRADRRLLFAELSWTAVSGSEPSFSSAAGTECDCVLQYKDKGEIIGFNHMAGRNRVAHIAYADGHVEQLRLQSGSDASESDLQNLTKWLCEGTDFSFNGKRYEELK